jgi:hypothetical protein
LTQSKRRPTPGRKDEREADHPASKFKERYSTFGFNAEANLDQGVVWPTSFALKDLTDAEEKRIAALVKKAVR